MAGDGGLRSGSQTGMDPGTHHTGVEESDAYETTFTAGEPPSIAVVRSVAAIEGVEARELDPLAHDVDTDALDALFEESRDSGPLPTLEFSYAGYRVVVRGDGHVTLREDPDA